MECQNCKSLTLCTYCALGFYLLNNLCLSTCPARYLADNSTRTCQPCPYDCYTCDLSGACLTCNQTADSRIMAPLISRCVPLVGYYELVSSVARLLQRGGMTPPSVFQCPPNCIVCNSASVCSFCSPQYFMRPDTFCYTTCDVRYV